MHTLATRDDSSCAVSVVAPCFNEEEVLDEFHRRTALACHAATGSNYEIVLVDDGSRDRSWEIICGLSSKDPHTIGVRLLRNHGHQLAATAGLSIARGRSVMLIDADLQDPPELLSDMLAIVQQGADVVYGKRISREGETLFKKVSAAAFYRLLGWLGSVPIPTDSGDFRLMSARVVEILMAMPERQRFIRGMVSWIGGQQVPIYYERHARARGSSKYPLSRMFRLSADAITSFSIVPLRLATWLGLATAGLALSLLVYTIAQWSRGGAIPGWASVMTAISLFSGAQLLVLGILGEYLGRLVQEAKGRPLFLIDKVTTVDREFQPPVDFAQLSPAERRSLLSAPARDAHDMIPPQRFANCPRHAASDRETAGLQRRALVTLITTARHILRPAAYGAVGLLNTLIDFLAFWALLDLMPALLANVISFSLGATQSFVLNTLVTFHDRRAEQGFSPQRALRFASVALGCLALSSGTLLLLLHVLPVLYAKAVSVLATFAAGYILNDLIVFKAGDVPGD